MIFFFAPHDVVITVIVAVLALGVAAGTWWWFYRATDAVRKKGLGVPPQPSTIEDQPPPNARAGWYPVDGGQRFWDGREWTTPVIRPGSR